MKIAEQFNGPIQTFNHTQLSVKNNNINLPVISGGGTAAKRLGNAAKVEAHGIGSRFLGYMVGTKGCSKR